MAARDIKKQQREEETTSLDHNSNSVSLNDVVRILKGPFKVKLHCMLGSSLSVVLCILCSM